jgi:hypothetical protein
MSVPENKPYVFDKKVLSPGDKVFMIHNLRGNGRWMELVVEATINETVNIYSHPERNVSIWHYRYLDSKKERATAATDKIDENGWPIHEEISLDLVRTLPLANQMLWLDEPIGHAVNLDDECWLTLEEAMWCVRFPCKKKGLRRKLKRARQRVQGFIRKTWGRQKHPGFDTIPMKKVYVRRY